MPEKPDTLTLNLRVALRASPVEDADDFARLVAAVLAFRDVGGAFDRNLASRLAVTEDDVHRIANGVLAPTPLFRREAVKKLRGIAAELGVKED